MTNTKFTPGPWRHSTSSNFGNVVQAYSGKTGEYDDGWRTVAMVQACCASNNYSNENENQQANICLIVTAPELYDALLNLLVVWENQDKKPGWVKRFDEAKTKAEKTLAKARGKS